VDRLVAQGRVEPMPVDEARARAFVEQAATALTDLPNVTRDQNRYNLAYDAAHDVGEAMLAAYGYRTKHGPGQHDALGRYLSAVFDSPPEDDASQHFDQMRQDRNAQRYRAHPVTAAAAGMASNVATTLHAAAAKRMTD
jgi:hypothetical protein